MKIQRLALSACLMFSLFSPAQAEFRETETLAREGDQAPGTPVGVTFGNFASGATAQLTNAGVGIFRATVEGASVDSGNRDGYWMGTPGSLQLVMREGDQAPGLPTGVLIDSEPANPLVIRINDLNRVLIVSGLRGPGITPANDKAIWAGDPLNPTLVAQEGALAPGTSNGETIELLFQGPLLGNGDEIVFVGRLAGSTVGTSNDWAIWTGTPGNIELLIREGDQADGLPPGSFYSFSSSLQGLGINVMGTVVFEAFLTGNESGKGVWKGVPGNIQLVNRRGDIAPGTPAGFTFSNFREVKINDAEQIMFGGNVTGPGVTAANNQGVWAGDPGNLQLAYLEPQMPPGVNTGESIEFGTFVGAQILNANGQVGLGLSGGTATRLLGPGVTTANDEAIWMGPPGNWQLVVREGDSPSIFTDGASIGPRDLRAIAGNALDQLLYAANVVGPTITSGHNALVRWQGGVSELLIRTDDTFEVAPGDVVRAGLFRSRAVGGRQSGFINAFNDQGAVLLDVGIPFSSPGRQSAVILLGANSAPTADAGPDQTANEGALVVLDGSASSDPQNDPLNYSWTQLAGPLVMLDLTNPQSPQFVAPYTGANITLTFKLIVDDGTNSSEPDTVDVTVVNANSPPVADAGDDNTIKEGAEAQLDGSNSFDPEGDSPLGYAWTQTSGPIVSLLPSNTVVDPVFIAPLGVGSVLTFELTVDDGKESSAPDRIELTVVENTAPMANAGPDLTVVEASAVFLDGTGSADSDGGDILSFNWTGSLPLDDNTSATPSFTAPLVGPGGQSFDFDLVVADDDPVNPKSSAPDRVIVNVVNVNDPPRCDLARSNCEDSKIKSNNSCSLWPPNHKMVSVSIEGVTDSDSTHNTVNLIVTGVTMDEPVNGQGDGDTSPDAVIQGDSVLLRSERAGGGNGRIYEVSFIADDGLESCTGSVRVGVPKSRKGIAVDDGQVYDATTP